MRIGIDGRELLGRPTGVGRYLLHVLEQWARRATEGSFGHDVLIYSPAALPDLVRQRIEAMKAPTRLVEGTAGTWWEQVQLPPAINRDRPDIFFAPAYTSPLRISCPVAQTIHDVSFLAHPEWFSARERLRRAWITRSSARKARVVLTDSQFSATEIHNLIGVPDHHIRVIPLGLTAPGSSPTASSDMSFAGAAAPAFQERKPLVLFVGSVFNRRNVPDLIRAFARLTPDVPSARLEIVGENRTYPYQDLDLLCRSLGVTDRVGLRAYVSDEELTALYRSARVFAFLSEYEGFGLTPLEALSCGIPAVVLDTAVARETCGGAAQYIQAGDDASLTRVLSTLLADESAHRDALAAAPAVLTRYRWEDAAGATLKALEDAAS